MLFHTANRFPAHQPGLEIKGKASCLLAKQHKPQESVKLLESLPLYSPEQTPCSPLRSCSAPREHAANANTDSGSYLKEFKDEGRHHSRLKATATPPERSHGFARELLNPGQQPPDFGLPRYMCASARRKADRLPNGNQQSCIRPRSLKYPGEATEMKKTEQEMVWRKSKRT